MRLLIISLLAATRLCAAEADVDKLTTEAAAWESGKDMSALRALETLVWQSGKDIKLRRDLEAGLVNMLGSTSTMEAKRFACQQLAVVGTDRSLTAIGSLLNREQTAGFACLALRKNPSPRADDTLRNALPSLTGRARLQVIYTLGGRRSVKSVDALATLARNPDLPTAEAAIGALGEIGSEESYAALAAVRKASLNPALERAMSDALLRAADRFAEANAGKMAAAIYDDLLAGSQLPDVRQGALLGLFRVDYDGGERRIIEVLNGRDDSLKAAAISAVSGLPGLTASQKIGRLAPRLSPQEQAMLVDALAMRGDPLARTAIADHLTSKHREVRLAAIAAMGKLGDVNAVPDLVKALVSASDPDEQAVSEQALVDLHQSERTDKELIAETGKATDSTKALLLPVLARRNLRSAMPLFLKEAANPDKSVAKAAFTALGRMAGENDLGSVLDKLAEVPPAARSDAEASVMQVLARVENEERRSEIVFEKFSKATNVEARCSFIRILPGASGAKALTAVQAAITDPTPQVCDAAIRALSEWRNLACWNDLLTIYRQPKTETYRVLALRGMARLLTDDNAHPSPILFARYRQLLDGARNDSDRRLILGALAGAAHPDALPLAIPLLANPEVKPEAEQAIRQIAEAIKRQHPQAARDALSKLK